MFDRIIYIGDDSCNVKLKDDAQITMNLMNLHLVFEDDTKKILAEVDDLDGNILKARFLYLAFIIFSYKYNIFHAYRYPKTQNLVVVNPKHLLSHLLKEQQLIRSADNKDKFPAPQ